MLCNVVRLAVSRKSHLLLALTLLFLVPPSLASAAEVTLAWDASPDTNVVGYKIYYGVTSRTYTNSVPVGNVTTATVSNLLGNATYYFAATAVDDLGQESDFSGEVSTFIQLPNQSPTLNSILDLVINESAGPQIVNLSGIGSGAAHESQTLTVTATSSNPSLIPTPTVSYTSPATTGSLSFTPVPFAFGSAIITVTVDDGALTNSSTSRTFMVTVSPVNQEPTLNTLANVTINENAAEQTVSLTGISSGATNETQTLTITASSSNTDLIPTPTVTYTSPNSTGSLRFTPVAFAFGTATITVNVNDGAASNNLVTRIFTVTVNPVNQAPTLNTLANVSINENAPEQTVSLSGIGSGATNENQTLTITASSSNTGLIPTPTVTYTSPNSTGSLRFTPIAYAFGTATITVNVNDGGASNNVVTRTFTVTVNPVNQEPTLNTLANVTVNENAAEQTVSLSGIGSGATNETQTLTVTASSSNTGLIPTPTITYTSPSSTGSLRFTPVAFAFGTATITVNVNDGGTSNNVVTRTFTVTVNPVNQPPTLNTLANVTVNENAAEQTVSLSGIGSGATNENQTLTINASSSNTGLIPTPTVTYTSPNSTGSLRFTPVAYASGTATITVNVNDGGTTNNVVTRTFTVTVNPVNQAPTIDALANVVLQENAGLQSVNLSGIGSGAPNETQTLVVTASSSNTGLIPTPVVTYTSPNPTGTLSFTPVSAQSGTATITVTVNDGGSSNSVTARTFTVTVNHVNEPPIISAIPDHTIGLGSAVPPVAFTVSDAESAAASLSITTRSDNFSLVRNNGLSLGGSGTNRTLTIVPEAGAVGSANLTINVSDGTDTVSRTFRFTIRARPGAPLNFRVAKVE